MTANHRPLEEGDIELIERVKATPCLYDTRDPEFRLVFKKQQQWQSVAEGLIMTHWEEARRRWTVLRDRYARELKQLLLHPDSMEYGKSEFFRRMDFLRSFVKKRSVRRKPTASYEEHIENIRKKQREVEEGDDNQAIPIKIFKVDGSVSSFESYDQQEQQQQNLSLQDTEQKKSFVIEDSQDSSSERFNYIEQEAGDTTAHEHDENTNPLEEHCEGEQEYHEYVEDTSVAYEAVEEDARFNVSNQTISTSAVSNIISTNNSFNNIADNLTQLPQLQQRPSSNTICTLTPTAIRESNDSEEYFSKTIALYLKQLSRRYKIKAKVEMLQILEKYIELEEMKNNCCNK